MKIGKLRLDKYTICKSFFSKIRGLMFRPKNYKKPLLFIFSKRGIYPIHSFFCRSFLAVWINEDNGKMKIIDEKIVYPFCFSVSPKTKFNRILEVPLHYFKNSDGKRNI
jgi:uncharacterized membrane protein (UPF0127 family)